MTKNVLHPKNLPYAGAIVQAVLFSIAGNAHFPFMGWLLGLGVGVVVNWAVAYASSRISDIAKSRKALGIFGMASLMAISPVVICSSLGWTVSNFSWAVACDLSILLSGAIAGKSLIPADVPQKSAEAEPAKKKPARPSFACGNAAAGCGKTFASQNAANAHGRSCQYKPAAVFEAMVQKEVK